MPSDPRASPLPCTLFCLSIRVVLLTSHKDNHAFVASQAREVDGELRLCSIDHASLFITNERDALTTELLRGVPHSLLLSTSTRELFVLVPAVLPVRPNISSEPFSTALVLDRTDPKWVSDLSSRTFMYPVHVSLSFLQTTTLSSALYLLSLKLYVQRPSNLRGSTIP